MTDWLPIRIKTEPAKMKHVQARIEGFPEQAVEKFLFQRLQSITAMGADVMRNYIKYERRLVTKTGLARVAKGGKYATRVDSERMVDSVKWEGRKVGNKYKFRFGWIDGEPGYSIFQEHGTSNGVVGMESLAYAMEFVRRELHLLETTRSAYKTTKASPWSE